MAKTQTKTEQNVEKTEATRITIRGKLIFLKRGINTHFNKDNTKETTQLTISLKESPRLEDIRKAVAFAFRDNGKKFTPAFAKSESDNITLNTQFDLQTLYDKIMYNDIIDFFADNDDKSYNADVSIIVALKEGAMYPVAVKVNELGETYQSEITEEDFDEDAELPFE